ENWDPGTSHTVGLPFLLDTQIGANDGLPFLIPGAASLRDPLKDFRTPREVPDYLLALVRENRPNPGTVASGRFKGAGGGAPAARRDGDAAAARGAAAGRRVAPPDDAAAAAGRGPQDQPGDVAGPRRRERRVRDPRLLQHRRGAVLRGHHQRAGPVPRQAGVR